MVAQWWQLRQTSGVPLRLTAPYVAYLQKIQKCMPKNGYGKML